MLYAKNYKYGLMGWTFAAQVRWKSQCGSTSGWTADLPSWTLELCHWVGFRFLAMQSGCILLSKLWTPFKKRHTSSSRLCELFIFPFHLLKCRFVQPRARGLRILRKMCPAWLLSSSRSTGGLLQDGGPNQWTIKASIYHRLIPTLYYLI